MRAVKITNKMLIASVGRYAAAQEWRGVSILSTLEKLMKGWLIMGLSIVPKGDKAKIAGALKARARGKRQGRVRGFFARQMDKLRNLGSVDFGYGGALAMTRRGFRKVKARGGRTGDPLDGSAVVRIVAALDIYSARRASPRQQIALAKRFLKRREASANTLRAGLIGPLRKLRGTAPDGAKLRNMPSEIEQKAAERAARVAVNTWASARKTPKNKKPLGIKGKAGDVFMKKMGDLHRQVEKWYAGKIRGEARRAGLAVQG